MNQMKTFFLAPAAALVLLSGAAQATTDEAIAERLKPVGTVCIAGQDCDAQEPAQNAEPATAEVATETTEDAVAEPEAVEASEEPVAETTAAVASGRTGEEVTTQTCNVCHATGLLESPKTGDTAAWQARYDAEGGIDALVSISKQGKGGMPPMGTCVDCTDEELKSAIEFMSGL